jgi:hypothetical protein
MLALPAVVRAQFDFITNNGTITITRYTGPGGAVVVPSQITGLPVTSIGEGAFSELQNVTNVVLPGTLTSIGPLAFVGCSGLPGLTIPNGVTNIGPVAFHYCTNLTNVVIPDSVTSLDDGLCGMPGCGGAFSWCIGLTNVTLGKGLNYLGLAAFWYCPNLKSVNFKGAPPAIGQSVFQGDNNLTVYYLPGTTGWGPTFGGRPTALWLPQVQTGDSNFGVQANQFGFNIAWASGQTIVVEAAENLITPVWVSLQTNTLTSDSFYFSDPDWTNYPGRFYRTRSP